MQFSQLIKAPAPWMTSLHDDQDIILTSRIRLARNLGNTPFPGWAKQKERHLLCQALSYTASSLPQLRDSFIAELSSLNHHQKQLLVERHLISRELAARSEGSGVAISKSQSLSILFNEEDHLRLQYILPGLQLQKAWVALNKVDSSLEKKIPIPYAYNARLGYLTSCPTNLGTGMRASVMLHIPGLVLNGAIEQVFKAAEELNLTIRGLYGEGTESMGNLFQISNQSTLGEREEVILDRLKRVVTDIAKQEKNARINFYQNDHQQLTDRICKAYALLKHSILQSSKEALEQISMLRLGASLGIIEKTAQSELYAIILKIQPAHLNPTDASSRVERETRRATIIRELMEKIPEPNTTHQL
ncbi:MAG: protein arginine kinase [Akkermansia sp.]